MTTNQPKSNALHSNSYSAPPAMQPTAIALAVLSMASAFPAQSSTSQDANAIAEVIVTARKRQETLQEVPVAVNVLNESAITSARIEGVKDLGTVVPGLVTSRVAAATSGNIYLRGVGTGAGNPLIDQAVAINIDGVGISSAQLMNAGMFDLQQIEVLRGPQALFYGKNSPGGVIAIHTKDPGEEMEAKVSALYETETEQTSLRAIVSGPLNDSLGARLSLGWSETDKHRFDVENQDVFIDTALSGPTQIGFGTDSSPVVNENLYVMGTLVWDPTDNVSVNLKYAHLKDEQEGNGNFTAQRIICPYGTPQFANPVAGYDNCSMDGTTQIGGLNPDIVAQDPHFPDHTGNGFNNSVSNFASLNIQADLTDELTLTSVTGYFDNEEDRLSDATYELVSGLGNSRELTFDQWSQEIRLNSAFDGPVNFTAGLYYEEKEIRSSNAIVASNLFFPDIAAVAPPSVVGLVAFPAGTHVNEMDGTAYSFFTQVEWDINDQWTLAAGARYSYEEKEGAITVTDLLAVTEGALDSLEIPLTDPKPDWENVSPEVTLRYQYSQDIMFFGSFKTAFKSGGLDGGYQGAGLIGPALGGFTYNNVYNEENVEGFEFGMKSTLLDGTLRLNITAYTFEYDDLQLAKLSASEGGVPSLRVVNAASATLEGIEVETVWATPIEGLTLTANIALADSSYDDYIADCFTGQTIAMGCDQDFDTATGQFTGADQSGNSLPNASDESATFALDYLVGVGNDWDLGLNISTSYKSEYNPSSELYPDAYLQDAYWWTNASASLYSSDGSWEFFVRAVNLGDEYFTNNTSAVPFSGNGNLTGTNDGSGIGDIFGFVEGGRQFTLGFTYRIF